MSSPCWNCHEAVNGLVCVGCGALQAPPPVVDPYVLLGLPRRWHLDLAEVESAYRALARVVHPDKYVKKSAAERRFALSWTAALNDARRVLKDPERRAWYLATGSPTPKEGRKLVLDPAFLQQMFEWREEEEDSPGATRTRAQALRAELEGELERVFTAWETGAGDLAVVEDRLSRLKYVTGLTQEQAHGEHRH